MSGGYRAVGQRLEQLWKLRVDAQRFALLDQVRHAPHVRVEGRAVRRVGATVNLRGVPSQPIGRADSNLLRERRVGGCVDAGRPEQRATVKPGVQDAPHHAEASDVIQRGQPVVLAEIGDGSERIECGPVGLDVRLRTAVEDHRVGGADGRWEGHDGPIEVSSPSLLRPPRCVTCLGRVAGRQIHQEPAVQLCIARIEQPMHHVVVGDADDGERSRLERIGDGRRELGTLSHDCVSLRCRAIPHRGGMSGSQEGGGQRLAHQSEADDCDGELLIVVHAAMINLQISVKVKAPSQQAPVGTSIPWVMAA